MADEVDLPETRRLLEAEIQRLEALPPSQTMEYLIRMGKTFLEQVRVAQAISAQPAHDAGVAAVYEVVGSALFDAPQRSVVREYRAVFSYPPSFLGKTADRYSSPVTDPAKLPTHEPRSDETHGWVSGAQVREVTLWVAADDYCGPDGCPASVCGGPHRAVMTDLGVELVRDDQEPIGNV